jgi:hypothetical protein
MSSYQDIEKALPSGDVIWQFKNETQHFMQRSEYPSKKTVASGTTSVREKPVVRQKRQPGVFAQLLPFFDDMAPLYSRDAAAEAERYLRGKFAEFATNGGAKYLGLPSTRAMDPDNILKMAAYILDKPIEQLKK